MKRSPTIGVLALQGDFDAHRTRLEELGAEVDVVRDPERLETVDPWSFRVANPRPS
jgi:pyridoxal 5'-phosphate synthase pdxT subunit